MKKMILITVALIISNVSFADATKASCRDGQTWKTVTIKSIANTTAPTTIRAQYEVDAYKAASARVAEVPVFTPQAPFVLECSDNRITEVDGNLELVLDYNLSGPSGLVYRAYNCNGTIWVFTAYAYGWSDGQGNSGSGYIPNGFVGVAFEGAKTRHCAYMGTYED